MKNIRKIYQIKNAFVWNQLMSKILFWHQKLLIWLNDVEMVIILLYQKKRKILKNTNLNRILTELNIN